MSDTQCMLCVPVFLYITACILDVFFVSCVQVAYALAIINFQAVLTF
jgi:hypothetical protein